MDGSDSTRDCSRDCGGQLNITFDFVPLHTVVREIAPHVGTHYAQMTDGDDYGFPDIDWDSYLLASQAGLCRVVTVRDGGKLVGYSVYSFGRNLRYKEIIEASSDGIFLEKEYRGKLSSELLKRADQYLKALGIHETSYVLSDERVGKLLARNGYTAKYKVWTNKYNVIH